MSGPPTPSGYDVSKAVSTNRSDCMITVGFDQQQNHIPRFLVRLHYADPPDTKQWTEIARFDHNETSAKGHDVYREGLHIDVTTPSGTVKLHPQHGGLPRNRGAVIRRCVDYLSDGAQYFIDVYEGDISPGGPPHWPDGGDEVSHMLIRLKSLQSDMSRDPEPKEVLSPEDLTELLAEATATSPDEVDRQAEDLELGSPHNAEVISEE